MAGRSIPINYKDRIPVTAPHHSWLTSPARSHAGVGQGTELPLHLIALILNHLDNAADLARVTRTSRLFYYMALPRLYEDVTLRSYADIRYVNGRPEGFGSGSPFAMGLNTLVSRTFTDYVHKFKVIGDTREHDTEDYSKGRVPDNSMMLQVAMRAAIDKMKNLTSFAWELNTKPLQTVYQAIMAKPMLTSLTLRCQTKRIPRPTTVIPPLPNLTTLVVYDIDPLCYPDDFSLVLLTAKKLENLKLHWNPRMRETGEESVNLINYFGRCLAAKHVIPVKRMAMYNLYARNTGEGFEHCTDAATVEELTIVKCMGSSGDPMNVFMDNTWRVSSHHPVHHNMKMLRMDIIEKEHAVMLARFHGLERFYLISNTGKSSKPNSTADTPTTPSINTPTNSCSSANGTPLSTHECKSVAGDYLAVIQSNHSTMRHLLLSDKWQLNEEALLMICKSCPNLEQIGFSCSVPPLDSLRHVLSLVPKLYALRILIRAGSEFAEKVDSMDVEMHQFALATELWQPEYMNLRYFGMGNKIVFKLGAVVYPPKGKGTNIPPGQEKSMNARRLGPMRKMERVEWADVQHVEIWGMDNTDFDPAFP
ncbi:hypothetical protein K505DRAFT_365823 [Melanomma pulvis-pyrius CBS 109.77]|uniref:F-box domain-containing protein n=1 Tax=Melanomma pulvis-pyrius CBS 109.77 TaxID=1314802 RepID=A0A6A6WYK5_9PLEO|nr:hypothetical protein K505DRAFT_365823 [Melanomma pulvis-pyrius CBS 109.77]